jgi:2,3-diaminopropionate biosynthesis protein SbnA
MIKDSILDTIGGTPLVRLVHFAPDNGSEVLVKLEGFNPAGSIKDRAAWFMIREAVRSGALRPGATIVESTSGNFGKSLAMIGAACGYHVVLVVDPKAPASMVRFAQAFGAEIEMVDQPDEDGGYQRPRIEHVQKLLAENPDAFCPDQYNNPDNPRAHREETAREIAADAGTLDVLVAAVSTGGHISGLAGGLRSRFPGLHTVAVDAVGSSIFGYPFHSYAMRGLGLAWCPGNLDVEVVDSLHRVADHEAFAMCRVLAEREALLVGESGGAVLFAALHQAWTHPGSRVVAVVPDSGLNYIDESFDEGWLIDRGHGPAVAACRSALLSGKRPRPTFSPTPVGVDGGRWEQT